MDKFEQAMQQMAQMTEEDRMKMIESKRKPCICGGCPTYNDCAKENNELLYCALGKSPSVSQRKTVAFVQAVHLPSRWDLSMSISGQQALKENKEECNPGA